MDSRKPLSIQPIDALTLKRLALEWHTEFKNAKIQKIYHPSAQEFWFLLWHKGQKYYWYLNLSPANPCIFITERKEDLDFISVTFPKPTSTCLLLRKYGLGAKILSLETLPCERVLNVLLQHTNELGNQERIVFSLELMGKHSNWILYAQESQIILGVAHSVSLRMSRFRDLAPGLPYQIPPRPMAKSRLEDVDARSLVKQFSTIPKEDWPEAFSQKFFGMGKQMVSLILNILPLEAFLECWKALYFGETLFPALHSQKALYTLWFPPEACRSQDDQDWQRYPALSPMIRDYYTDTLKHLAFTKLKERLLSTVSGPKQKLMNRIEGILHEAEEERVDQYQYYGHLILSHYSQSELPPSPLASIAHLTDMSTQQTVSIEVNPELSWIDNAQQYYKKAKKIKSRREHIQVQREEWLQEKAYYEDLSQLIEQAEMLEELYFLEEELSQSGILPPIDSQKKPNQHTVKEGNLRGILKLSYGPGVTILIGKTGLANAAIMSKLSKPHDLWFHTHGMPGSHVLVKTEPSGLSEVLLADAAQLALYYSAGRQSAHIPVHYTEIRHVRKIPQSYPGHVTYQKEKTIHTTVSMERITQLLELAKTSFPHPL